MAIKDVIKMWSRTQGNHESKDLLEQSVRWREGYTVAHDPGELKSSILRHPDIPKIGDPFEDMPWVFCKNRVPKQISPILTIVEAEYEGEVGPNDEGGTGSPIDDEPEISFENVVSTEPIDTDGTGSQIITAAKEPIDGVTKPISDILMSVRRNFLDINLPATQDYLDSVNSDPYPESQPFPAGTGHLERFRATPRILAGSRQFYEVEAQILFRQIPPSHTNMAPERAWWARVRHEGWRYVVDPGGADERIVHAVDENQAPVSRPVLLDEVGNIVTDLNDVHWLEFQVFTYRLPYAALGLI